MKSDMESEPASSTKCPSCGSDLPRRTLRCPLCGFHFEPLSDAERRQTGTYLRPTAGLGKLLPRRVLFPVAVGILVAALGYWFLSRQAGRDRLPGNDETRSRGETAPDWSAGAGQGPGEADSQAAYPGLSSPEVALLQSTQVSGVTVSYRGDSDTAARGAGNGTFELAALLDGNAASCFAPFSAEPRRVVDFTFDTARRLSHVAITHCQDPAAQPTTVAVQLVTDDGSVRRCLVPSDGTGVADLGGAWSSVVGLSAGDTSASSVSLAEVVFFEFPAPKN